MLQEGSVVESDEAQQEGEQKPFQLLIARKVCREIATDLLRQTNTSFTIARRGFHPKVEVGREILVNFCCLRLIDWFTITSLERVSVGELLRRLGDGVKIHHDLKLDSMSEGQEIVVLTITRQPRKR